MVGRAMELARLLGLLDSVAAGEASVALVSGDAGVGKTRLVSELAGRARERGFCVLTGRCAELGDSVPYLPLADALRSVTGDAAARVAELVADRPVLGRLLPDHGPGTQTAGDGWELARQQLFGAVLGLLTELAETNPVLPRPRGDPALGRPVHARPAYVLVPGAAPRAGGGARQLPDR